MVAEEQQLPVKLCTSFKSSALMKGDGTYAFSHLLHLCKRRRKGGLLVKVGLYKVPGVQKLQ